MPILEQRAMCITDLILYHFGFICFSFMVY